MNDLYLVIWRQPFSPWLALGVPVSQSLVDETLRQAERQPQVVEVGFLVAPNMDALGEAWRLVRAGYRVPDHWHPVAPVPLLPEGGPLDPADEREQLESGPGGDHDTPYQYEAPANNLVRNAWSRLLTQVTKGALGGPDDGA